MSSPQATTTAALQAAFDAHRRRAFPTPGLTADRPGDVLEGIRSDLAIHDAAVASAVMNLLAGRAADPAALAPSADLAQRLAHLRTQVEDPTLAACREYLMALETLSRVALATIDAARS